MTMKLVKKFKKKMGLVRASNVSNNAPALRFHQVHGDNIRLSNDRTVARRVESFCKGITFSSRPVKPNEKVFIKFLELRDSWNGVVRFGFTNNDPINCRNGLPKYACPDLTNKPGYWAKALHERHVTVDTVLHFFYTTSGDLCYGINGQEKGVLLQDIDTRNPLWVVLDVYGNSTGVEIIDVRDYLNNSRRNLNHETMGEEMDRWIQPAMSALTLNSPPSESTPSVVTSPVAPPSLLIETAARQVSPAVELPREVVTSPAARTAANLAFHGTRGKNVKFNDYQNIASRNEREFGNGYVFSSRPVCPGESIVIQVRHTLSTFVGGLGFGLTACDPAKLRSCDLTDDADTLLDRPEYWVVMKDVAGSPQIGDTLCFTLNANGAVLFSKNNSPPRTVLHVDVTPALWMFFDIYGSTQKIALLGSTATTTPTRHPVPRSAPTTPWNEVNRRPVARTVGPAAGGNLLAAARSQPQLAMTLSRVTPSSGGYYHQSRPRSIHLSPEQLQVVHRQQVRPSPPPPPPPQVDNVYETLASTTTGKHMDVVHLIVPPPAPSTCSSSQPSSLLDMAYDECTICCEKAVDSVLYTCGHMCLCYECAIQQWRGRGGGQCPICRAVIRDVIRTYRP